MTETNSKAIEKSIDSFDKFLSEVGQTQFHQTNGQSFLVLFRGQEVDKPLLPKIARKKYFSPDIAAIEKNLIKEFERIAYPHVDSTLFQNEWDALALAQHHTLPTRLLDWTENPLAALWFAFIKEKTKKPPRVVWAFSITQEEVMGTSKSSPYDVKLTTAFQPNHITRTITAQSGWFTVHALNKKPKNFIRLETNSAYKGRLTKFTFCDSLRLEILDRLNRMGINTATLFPDLYGISRHLEWKIFKKVSS